MFFCKHAADPEDKSLTSKLKARHKIFHWKDRRQENSDAENMEVVSEGKADEMGI